MKVVHNYDGSNCLLTIMAVSKKVLYTPALTNQKKWTSKLFSQPWYGHDIIIRTVDWQILEVHEGLRPVSR